MPLYRYECTACDGRGEYLHGLDDAAPRSRCCNAEQQRLMPRRVRGKVLEPGQTQAERKADEHRELMIRAGDTKPPRRDPSPLDIPQPSYSGPPTSKADLDARWRDTTEAMASWQANSLTADGVPYEKAKRQAEQHQQAVSARAEADNR
jgi:hypothetical protein